MGRKARLVALLAVFGPGLLAGLSDDDPAGITTYSILGAEHGYRLTWVLVLATGMLILYHLLGVRLGAVTGQGLAGLVRERHGVRVAVSALLLLGIANLGTTCAEFAGIAAAFELAGIPRLVSVPVAAVLLMTLVIGSAFHRVEKVLLALAATLATYIAAGILAGPDWSAALAGAVVPRVEASNAAILAIAATVGTTIAPWGLAFIQSYAVDKRLRPGDLGAERIDVVVGAVLTGVIGFFVIVACAATLHATGRTIEEASDAAQALEPFAGTFASSLFVIGLVGAALLAGAVVPLSTAYSVAEVAGSEARLDDRPSEARLFYGTYVGVTVIAAAIVMVPTIPLVAILYLTQALNAIMLVPLLLIVNRVAADEEVMGSHATGRLGRLAGHVATALVALAVAALAVGAVVG